MRRSLYIFRIFLIPYSSFLLSFSSFSQPVDRIDPPSWWVGMHNPEVQLMMHGKGIAQFDISTDYPGVQIYQVHKVENPNYLFVDLIISDTAKAGTISFHFNKGKMQFQTDFALMAREKRSMPYGLAGDDLIYLIMPDRFSNGDTTNDAFADMAEPTANRNEIYTRHGGDLQGVINHLDHIKQLGMTAIWLTPPMENDQPSWSYHGYAITDNYNIDKRMGDNALFKTYAAACHKNDLKVVLDVVPNHIGSGSYLMKDMPMHDWVHQFDTYTKTNYRAFSLADPHASAEDKMLMADGWFDKHMPDVNQSNPFVAKYITQNCIWWIEYAQVDAFRIDTYTYSDLDFLVQWKKDINAEYPGFYMFGEVWTEGNAVQAYFAGNNNINSGYNSMLDGVTDFNLYWSMLEGLNGNFGWVTGLGKIYLDLTQDFLYQHPEMNAIFLGNHDLDRIYSAIGEDPDKMKMAIAFLMTMRGIPQWYYGDEILMKNFKAPDGLVRSDFPGGWPGDSINKFNGKNLTPAENDIYTYTKTLANWRHGNDAIKNGKLMHFAPENDMYVYFRYTDTHCVMVVMNSSADEKTLDTKRFAERMTGFTKAKNVATGATVSDLSSLQIAGKSCLVLELMK
ncbi:MAG: glycoside hydrolase family 13 protein [Chitinophagales bacterium]